jgi:hypothetical protein
MHPLTPKVIATPVMRFSLALIALVSAVGVPAIALRPAQDTFVTPTSSNFADTSSGFVDLERIQAILAQQTDPVEAMLLIDPSMAKELAEQRLLQLFNGKDAGGEPKWMTEGDKMGLRRQGIDWIDLTGRDSLVSPDFDARPSEYRAALFSYSSAVSAHTPADKRPSRQTYRTSAIRRKSARCSPTSPRPTCSRCSRCSRRTTIGCIRASRA